MKHLALAAKFGTLACSPAVTLDAAKRLWNVALPLADTAAGRAISFSSLRSVLMQMAKGGVIDGGSVRAQVNVVVHIGVACVPNAMHVVAQGQSKFVTATKASKRVVAAFPFG